MKHVFYFMALFPIMWELSVVTKTRKVFNFKNRIKGKKFDDYESTERSYAILHVLYIIWVFIGIFSFQWPVFLFIFSIGFIPKNNLFLMWIDSAITFAALMFIVLNAYHFKIDVLRFLFN